MLTLLRALKFRGRAPAGVGEDSGGDSALTASAQQLWLNVLFDVHEEKNQTYLTGWPFSRRRELLLDSIGGGFFIESLSPSSVSLVNLISVKRLESEGFIEQMQRTVDTIAADLFRFTDPCALYNVASQDIRNLPNELRLFLECFWVGRVLLGDIASDFVAEGYSNRCKRPCKKAVQPENKPSRTGRSPNGLESVETNQRGL